MEGAIDVQSSRDISRPDRQTIVPTLLGAKTVVFDFQSSQEHAAFGQRIAPDPVLSQVLGHPFDETPRTGGLSQRASNGVDPAASVSRCPAPRGLALHPCFRRCSGHHPRRRASDRSSSASTISIKRCFSSGLIRFSALNSTSGSPTGSGPRSRCHGVVTFSLRLIRRRRATAHFPRQRSAECGVVILDRPRANSVVNHRCSCLEVRPKSFIWQEPDHGLLVELITSWVASRRPCSSLMTRTRTPGALGLGDRLVLKSLDHLLTRGQLAGDLFDPAMQGRFRGLDMELAQQPSRPPIPHAGNETNKVAARITTSETPRWASRPRALVVKAPAGSSGGSSHHG